MTTILHTKTTINIAREGTKISTAKTANSKAEIVTATAKAAAIATEGVTAIGVTIIVIRVAKEVKIVMTAEEKIIIMLAIKASHIVWRKRVVALTPYPRVTVTVAIALQVIATFQAIASLVLVFVPTIIMWISLTWIPVMERYLPPMAPIQPNSIGFETTRENFLLSKDIVIASAQQTTIMQ
eukprot:4395426-Ditylum_brightwellii.AAC.1